MHSFPLTTTLIFLATTAALCFALIYGNQKAMKRQQASNPKMTTFPLLIILAAWLLFSGLMAQTGFLANFETMPPRLPLFLMLCTGLTFILAFSPVGTRMVHHITLPALIGFQFFRVPVEWVLYRLHHEGIVPVQMTFEGYNFDILSGLSAGVLWLAAKRFALPRNLVAIWNVLGLALLLTIVTIALLSAPTSLRVFMEEPANTFVTGFPYVWLPAILVQGALFGHLLVFRALAARKTPGI